MGFSIGAIAYIWIAVLGAWIFLPRGLDVGDRLRIMLTYLLNAAILVIFPDHLITFFLTGFVVFLLAPSTAHSMVAFAIAAVPSIPTYITPVIPFPGIAFLITAHPLMLIVLFLLVPAAIRDKHDFLPQRTDFLILAFCFYAAALVGSVTNFTTGLRWFVLQLLTIALPYILIKHRIRSMETFRMCVRAFVAAAVILGCYCWVATALQWDPYRISEPFSILDLPDFRSGFLRIEATATVHSLGFLFVVAILFVSLLRSWKEYGLFTSIVVRLILVGGLLSTESRGALLGLAAACYVYIVFMERCPVIFFGLAAAGAAGAVAAAMWLLSGNPGQLDAYGTFAYRQELLTTSLDFIADHPFFGNVHYIATGRFDHLLTGHGIIDITNLYLKVALELGLIGLVLYFAPMFGPLLDRSSYKNQSHRREHAIVKAALVGWLALVVTTSDVGLTLYLGLVLAALGQALCRITKSENVAEPAGRKSIPVHAAVLGR